MSSLYYASLIRLVEDHDTEIRRVLTRRVGCVDTAADIVQETYRRLAHGELWKEADNPRALMYRIALNLATDHERRVQTQNRYIAEDAEFESVACPVSNPEGIVESQQKLDRLYLAVEKLPKRCRQVFILRKFEDLSQAEIAERLGLSRSSVEKHLRNALIALREALDD